ncbi:uncharacterized protein LOC110857200 [Folsomia candida]|uniref:Uncharacterized protein n=1 Tax=Folsomia candida TaxID=158441 RepID=A0A226DK64_FOLCA|nr:uncharacterized protein LOC110857200 [Folsomia candida]OXA45388.1 hypothetical protein Fcan01_19942 [Folsomia candida]
MNYFAEFVLICALVTVTASPSFSAAIDANDQSINGVVTNITRCGGYGTPIQLRVSNCEGKCSLMPGQVYNIEYDFIPNASASGLGLACDLVLDGERYRLFDIALPNSAVLPDLMYTVKFSVTPDEILSGQVVDLRAIIYHTDDRFLELCVETEVDIIAVP